jgi:hypothetical protein
MKKQGFGSITPKDSKYQVYFSNPYENKAKYIGLYDSKEKAREELNNVVF